MIFGIITWIPAAVVLLIISIPAGAMLAFYLMINAVDPMKSVGYGLIITAMIAYVGIEWPLFCFYLGLESNK